MAKIKVTSKCELYDGMSITFKAPCDGSAVDGLNVYYNNTSQSFSFRDAHGNNLAGLGNLFSSGAYIKAILNTSEGYAYLQNADTNRYLENHISNKSNPHGVTYAQVGAAAASHTHTKSQITDFPSSMPASDVYSWAKQSKKPSYTYSEVGAAAASHTHSQGEISGLTSALNLRAKIATGTYTGSGQYGGSVTINCGFQPKIAFIFLDPSNSQSHPITAGELYPSNISGSTYDEIPWSSYFAILVPTKTTNGIKVGYETTITVTCGSNYLEFKSSTTTLNLRNFVYSYVILG